MTDPTPQETGTPQAPETTATASGAPAPAPTASGTPATNADSPWNDPEKARAEIEKLRRENGAARTNAKAAAAEEARNALAQEIGKAIGLVKDNEPADPAQLAAQLTAQTDAAKQAQLELSVYRAASAAGADANALLDSRSFLQKVSGIDATDSAAITAAITEAVAANSALGSRTMPPNPAQGSSGNSGAAVTQLTQADLKTMTSAEILQAEKEGRMDNLKRKN